MLKTFLNSEGCLQVRVYVPDQTSRDERPVAYLCLSSPARTKALLEPPEEGHTSTLVCIKTVSTTPAQVFHDLRSVCVDACVCCLSVWWVLACFTVCFECLAAPVPGQTSPHRQTWRNAPTAQCAVSLGVGWSAPGQNQKKTGPSFRK